MIAEANTFAAKEVAAALAGGTFAAALAEGAPLMIVAGEPPHLRFASPAALALIGARSLEALEAALLSAESPGARRIRRLAVILPLGGAPRIERLRFYVNGAALPLGLVAAKTAGADGAPWLVISTPAVGKAEASQMVGKPEVEAPKGFVAPPLDGPVRFLWALDTENKFVASDPA